MPSLFSIVPQVLLVTVMMAIIGSSGVSAIVSALAVIIVIRVRRTKQKKKDELAAARIALAVQLSASEKGIPDVTGPVPVYNEVYDGGEPPPLPPNHPPVVTKANKAYGFRRKA